MRVVHFSLLEAHQSHALLNPLMTGRLTEIGSSLKQQNFYLLQIRHQRARSICYSTSGLQLSRSTMIYLCLLTVATSIKQSTTPHLVTSNGSHFQSGILAKSQTLMFHHGWIKFLMSGTEIHEKLLTACLRTLTMCKSLITGPIASSQLITMYVSGGTSCLVIGHGTRL